MKLCIISLLITATVFASPLPQNPVTSDPSQQTAEEHSPSHDSSSNNMTEFPEPSSQSSSTNNATKQEFVCKPGMYISQVWGKSQDHVEMLKFKCSDGTMSPVFGNPDSGTPEIDIVFPLGITAARVFSSDGMVDGIHFPYGHKIGTEGSHRQDYSGNCRSTGVVVTSDEVVREIEFKMDCTFQAITEEQRLRQMYPGGMK